MAEMITRTVKVTIEKEIKVSFPAEMGTPESIADWSRGLWAINGVDDIAKYAAEQAAQGGDGCNLDGIGRLGTEHTWFGSAEVKAETVFEVLNYDVESEIISEKES